MKFFLVALVAAASLLLASASSSSVSLCHEALQEVCPIHKLQSSGQQACDSCVQGQLHRLLPCSQTTLQEYCEQFATSTFWDLPTEQCPRTGLWMTEIPVCGSSKVNCWEQTRGQGRVDFLKQTVSSNQFPCKSGQSSTSFQVESSVSLSGGAESCTMDVKGFGGKEVSVGLCQEASRDGLYIGFDCPTSTGALTATGPTGKCEAGYGSYTATIKCPDFELVTYIKY